MKRENGFQAELIKELKVIFSNAVILKNDSSYLQGIPDLSIFVGTSGLFLNVKKVVMSPTNQIRTITFKELWTWEVMELSFFLRTKMKSLKN